MTSEEVDQDGLESGCSSLGQQRSVASNIGALMTSQMMTWILSTALIWVVPRYLGPEAFGSLRLATALWLIASVVATFGTSTLLTVEVARRPSTFKSILTNSLRLRFSLAAIVAPIVIAVLIFGPYDSQTQQVAIIVGLSSAVAMGVNAMEAALFGLHEMGEPSRIRVIAKVFTTASTVVVVLLGGRLFSVATVTLAGAVFSAWLFYRAVNMKSENRTARSSLNGTGLLIASVPFFAAEACRVIYQQIDTVVMSALVDTDAVGWYAAADTLFGSLLFIPVIVATAMFPAIAQLHERSPGEVPALLGQSLNTLLLVALPIGLGTIIVAPSFVDLLYGEDFTNAAPVLTVYGVVVTLSSLTILLGRFALATGRAAFWSSVMFAMTLLTIPLDLVLVPWTDQRFNNGAIGGALAYVVTEGLLIGFGLVVIGRGALTASSAKRLVRCLIAGAAMLAASWSFRDEFFVIPGAIAVTTYAFVIVILRTLEPHEIVYLRKLDSKLPFRRTGTPSP